MKKCYLWLCLITTAWGILGCSNNSNLTDAEKLFKDNPVTIQWDNKKENSSISSIHADVEVYSKNDRKGTCFEITNSYSMSVKLIDGVQYTRIDMGGKNDVAARSIITDGNEIVVINPVSNEVEMRIPALSETEKELRFFEPGNIGFGRVNLDFVKVQANRLALDISEAEQNPYLSITLPEDMLESTEYNKQLSSKIAFDTTTETLASVENISIQSDGTTVTSTFSPVYEEYNGELIKIGSVLEIDTKIPELVGELADDFQIYNSYDDIPEISQEELDEMMECGSVFEEDYIKFGNPADLSNKETVIELYTNVAVNQVDDKEFKLFF